MKSGKKPVILIIDSDQQWLENLGSRIRKTLEWDTFLVQEPTVLIQHIQDLQPCGLMVDLELGPIKGSEVVEIVRHINPDLPILVVSESKDPKKIIRCFRAGCTDFLDKNSTKKDLLSAIERHCSPRKKRPGSHNIGFRKFGEVLSKMTKLPTLNESSEALIKEALKRSKGNQSKAAKSLGISKQALSQRILRKKRE